MKKRGRKKHGSLLKNFKRTFWVFYILPFTVTEISARSSKNFTLFEVNSALGCKLHIFIQLPHSRFYCLAREMKKMVNRLLFTVFHQKLDCKI